MGAILDKEYWEVTEPFEAFLVLGHTDDSNTSFGSSKALGTVYLRKRVPAGSRMALLPGGRFIEVDGATYEAKLVLSDKHPFEKSYGPPPKDVEPSGLVSIDPFPVDRRKGERFSWRKLLEAGFQPYGRGIDFVLSESEVVGEEEPCPVST